MPRAEAARLLGSVRLADVPTVARHYFHGGQVGDGPLTVGVRGYRRPVRLRPGSSDFAVFSQVFLQGQYAGLPVRAPRVIIDAGANIGLASLFFLRRYPRARVIALEPEPENFAVAAANLRPYRHRCTLVRGALWSHTTRLALRPGTAHWAAQVMPAAAGGDGLVPAYSLADLMAGHGLPFVDLLKVDIEGAEEEVFRAGRDTVLRRVGCCAVELHGPACEAAFREAVRRHGFASYRRGELTVATRRPPRPAAHAPLA
jgi:FkbM family methyltransferase